MIAANVTDRVANLTGLTPATNYSVGVSAVTVGGASPVNNLGVFLTHDDGTTSLPLLDVM